MDERTRDLYRREVTHLARRANMNEQRLAQAVLELAQGADGDGGTSVIGSS
jgi:hypothetical protein